MTATMIPDPEEGRTKRLRDAYKAVDKAAGAFSNEPEWEQLSEMRQQLGYWLTERGVRP